MCAAHNDIIQLVTNPLCVVRKTPSINKVLLISGGGSGHEPLHSGFVGKGMLDAAIPGNVFSSPGPAQIIETVALINSHNSDILFLVKNYQGDVMNFEIATERLKGNAQIVYIKDDVSLLNEPEPRGLAGTLVYEKLLGAAAEQSYTLSQLVLLAEKIENNIASHGMQVRECIHPESTNTIHKIKDGKVELGTGIHGEQGRYISDDSKIIVLAYKLLKPIFTKLNLKNNDNTIVIINGMGATPNAELYITYKYVLGIIESHGVNVIRSLIGEFVTSLDADGITITICRVDDEMTDFWDAEAATSALVKENKNV